MFVIGITGGIGSGKSLVMRLMKEEFSSAVIDTDSIGHELLQKEKKTYKEVVRVFGREILDTKQEIDRKKLGSLVFSDKKKLEALNGILHPAVEKEVDKRLLEFEKENFPFVCLETALLFDVGYEKKCDEVWFVYTDEETRMKRLMKNRNLSEKNCKAIFNKQRSSEEFKTRSDRTIDNSLGEKEVLSQLRKIVALIRGGRNAGIT